MVPASTLQLPGAACRAGATVRGADVLIVGGGPAGSTAAIRLAQSGHRVVLLEKSHHPRFHIGESLLPANLPLLERLGVAEEVRSIGMEKWGAEFVSSSDDRRQEFEFARSWDKSLALAYQVRRSQFDEILIRRAAACGAEVIEGCRARDVEIDAHGRVVRVHAEHEDGRSVTFEPEQLIDASGRDTLLGQHLGIKRRNPRHSSAALYAHFRGARRASGRRAGNISLFWFEHGWFWFIPLADGATSVGAVVWPRYLKSRAVGVREFFLDTIGLCPPLAERLSGAQLCTEVEATGNYSYSCERSYGPNYLLIGDAYAFIDPVFSSGVLLAMTGGEAAAATIDEARTSPGRAARSLARYDRIARHGPRQFSWFIYRVTNPTMRELFLAPQNYLRMEEALLSVLAGDIYGSTPIWGSLRVFKGLYYLLSMAHLGRSIRAARRRARELEAARPVAARGGG
jgi:flavin-dependent dehydrogenase